MAVAADDEVARPHQPLLGQHDVGDPLAPFVVDVGDPLLPRPPTYAGEHGGGGDVLGRDDVSKTTTTFSGSKTRRAPILRSTPIAPAVERSLPMATSTFTVTNSPGSTAARPAWAARIFSLIVMPIVVSRPDHALAENGCPGIALPPRP